TVDLLAAFHCQPRPDRPPVRRVRESLDQSIALQVVDEPGDLASGRVEVIRKLPQRHVAAPLETEQDADPPLAQSVVLSPPLQPPVSGSLVSRAARVAPGIGLFFATLYTAPAGARRSMRTGFVYQNGHDANLMATAQVNYYRSCGLDLIGDRAALAAYAPGWRKGRLAGVLLMEGADPIETPSQLGAWTDRGVRIIGPAWGATRYSGGTGAPGGL